MIFTASCASPLGGIVLAADEIGLTGLWFTGAKYFGAGLPASAAEADTPILAEARRWLEGYFTGQRPAALPPLHPSGSPFRRAVWDILLTIPYGETTTYGRIAQQLAAQRGLEHLSAQAVGGAVGHNPISILIPCHRVIGANGSLTGYAGGMKKSARSWNWSTRKFDFILGLPSGSPIFTPRGGRGRSRCRRAPPSGGLPWSARRRHWSSTCGKRRRFP